MAEEDILSKLRNYASGLETEAEKHKLLANHEVDRLGHAIEMHESLTYKRALNRLYEIFPELKLGNPKE